MHKKTLSCQIKTYLESLIMRSYQLILCVNMFSCLAKVVKVYNFKFPLLSSFDVVITTIIM